MTAGWPPFGIGLLPYVLLFALMFVGNTYVVLRLFPRTGPGPSLADATILIGILLMALGLWFALLYAILDPGTASEVSVFIALNSMMAVVGCWAIALFLRAGAKPLRGSRARWPVLFATLLVSNELLMGVAFVLSQSGTSAYASEGWVGLATLVGDSLSSPWFFWAMLANMLVIVYWLPFERPDRLALTGLSISAAVAPWLLIEPVPGAAVMAALMGLVVLGTLLESRRGPLAMGYLRTLVVVWGAFVVMIAGEGALLLSPSPDWKTFYFGIAGLGAMGGELVYVLFWGVHAVSAGSVPPAGRTAAPGVGPSPGS